MTLLTAFSFFHPDPQELTLLSLTPSDKKIPDYTHTVHFERLLKRCYLWHSPLGGVQMHANLSITIHVECQERI